MEGAAFWSDHDAALGERSVPSGRDLRQAARPAVEFSRPPTPPTTRSPTCAFFYHHRHRPPTASQLLRGNHTQSLAPVGVFSAGTAGSLLSRLGSLEHFGPPTQGTKGGYSTFAPGVSRAVEFTPALSACVRHLPAASLNTRCDGLLLAFCFFDPAGGLARVLALYYIVHLFPWGPPPSPSRVPVLHARGRASLAPRSRTRSRPCARRFASMAYVPFFRVDCCFVRSRARCSVVRFFASLRDAVRVGATFSAWGHPRPLHSHAPPSRIPGQVALCGDGFARCVRR